MQFHPNILVIEPIASATVFINPTTFMISSGLFAEISNSKRVNNTSKHLYTPLFTVGESSVSPLAKVKVSLVPVSSLISSIFREGLLVLSIIV